METLNKIIEKLRSSNDVDAAFITGSHGAKESKAYSDIDLVIILKENKNNLYSLYRWIDGVFADIFFFDLADVKRISDKAGKHEDEKDPVFVSWLRKGDIKFDKSGATTALKDSLSDIPDVNLESLKKNLWQKINYNYVANKRYFESNDPLYHEALELRLQYSVVEALCGFVELRGVVWRGEKAAVKYLKENHPEFYNIFKSFLSSTNLAERYKFYEQMVDLAFTDEYKKWTEKDEVVIKKDFSIPEAADPSAIYAKSLLRL